MTAVGANVKTILFSVAFSNRGPSSSSTPLKAVVLTTLSSAAFACTVRNGKANTAAATARTAAIARLTGMASSHSPVWSGPWARLAINAGNGEKLVGVEACSADQRAIDIVDRQ